MKRILLLALLTSGLGRVCAQDGFVSQSGAPLSYNVFDHNGKAFVNPAPEVEGTPFLTDKWRMGTLVVTTNRRYDSVKIRINLLSQEVHVIDRNNTEIALAKGYIKQVIWTDAVKGLPTGGTCFQSGFPAVDNQDKDFFYEVLSQGKLWLLHSVRKVITERKDGLSGDIRKDYTTYDDYYVYDGKNMQRVRKDKSFILTIAGDKRDKIDAFLEANKLKARSAEDLRRIIDYYNTLP